MWQARMRSSLCCTNMEVTGDLEKSNQGVQKGAQDLPTKARDGVRRGCGAWIAFAGKRSDLEALAGDSTRTAFPGEATARQSLMK